MKINCSIPIFDTISESAKSYLEECATRDDAERVQNIYIFLYREFRGKPESFGCPLPCTRISYDLHVSYFHQNSGDLTLQKSKFLLYIYSSSNFIEDQVYDSFMLGNFENENSNHFVSPNKFISYRASPSWELELQLTKVAIPLCILEAINLSNSGLSEG